MNTPRKMLALMALILTLPSVRVAAGNPPASPDELAKRFEQAVKTKNKNAALELFDWEGVSSEMQAKQKFPIEMLFDELNQGLQLTSVKLGKLPSNVPAEQIIGGVKYIPNIPVLGAIHVMLDEDTNPSEFVFAYGKKDKAFFLSALVESKDNGKSVDKK